jgi:acyl-coenzyme A synthetase/AMP-(fatty) acid ligase
MAGYAQATYLVRADKEGFFWITGRKKETIKYESNSISPEELESVLLSHNDVTKATVYGDFDPERNTELPMACVTVSDYPREIDLPTLAWKIRQYYCKIVAPYK